MATIEMERKVRKKSRGVRPPRMSTQTDEPWKEILSALFKDFMEFAWPEIYDEIDWSKGFEFLDKELQSLVKHEKKGKKFVDKLVKVWHKKMGETFIILHIEVQNEKEEDFLDRLFTYYYRLWDRFKTPIVCLAVLIDNDESWRPSIYEKEFWNCHLKLKFPILKLKDFETKRDILEKSENPFAMVVLYQLSAMDSQYNAKKRYDLKFGLAKSLLKKEWNRDKIIALLMFLDGILRLPEPMELQFVRDLRNSVEETNMSYVTSFEYFAELRGIEKGIETGKNEGIQTGIQKGECRILISQLKSKFKKVPIEYIGMIKNANPDILLTWANRLLFANTIEEIFSND